MGLVRNEIRPLPFVRAAEGQAPVLRSLPSLPTCLVTTWGCLYLGSPSCTRALLQPPLPLPNLAPAWENRSHTCFSVDKWPPGAQGCFPFSSMPSSWCYAWMAWMVTGKVRGARAFLCGWQCSLGLALPFGMWVVLL